jgi:hypothetical protein
MFFVTLYFIVKPKFRSFPAAEIVIAGVQNPGVFFDGVPTAG